MGLILIGIILTIVFIILRVVCKDDNYKSYLFKPLYMVFSGFTILLILLAIGISTIQNTKKTQEIREGYIYELSTIEFDSDMSEYEFNKFRKLCDDIENFNDQVDSYNKCKDNFFWGVFADSNYEGIEKIDIVEILTRKEK